ncbi:Hypothetical protein D9617_1g087060 [Elsinoe fawcettii]|nr:Hypothetical protein D9617_1g087060 [Elsinoe fawcettii]
MTALRTPFTRSLRALRPLQPIRTYASQRATQDQASPGTASNVGTNPDSVSADQKHIKESRATDGVGSSPDTRSVQTPVTDPKGAATGMQEEDSSAQSTIKQDPGKSDGEKRGQVEEMGKRPLDAGDK